MSAKEECDFLCNFSESPPYSCGVICCCKRLPSDAADFVMEYVPLLKNCSSTMMRKFWSMLYRIAEASVTSYNQVDELCVRGFVKQVATLISTTLPRGGQASLSSSTYPVTTYLGWAAT
ncbi:hypothetical protein Tco_0152773 [Tanacetum coccineum]